MMAYEFWIPKLLGVEWILARYTGAQPNSTTIKPHKYIQSVLIGSKITIVQALKDIAIAADNNNIKILFIDFMIKFNG